jgi:multiple sugar transport system permease protein
MGRLPMRGYPLTALSLLLVAFYLFPVYWMVISGFKSNAEIFQRPPTIFPAEPTLESFLLIFRRDNMAQFLFNSFVIAGGTAALTILISSFAAYGTARMRSRWIDAALMIVLMIQVMPPAILAAPMFITFRQLGVGNTQLAVILADMTRTIPFALIMLRTAFLAVPLELEEAARIDGCSRVGAFIRVVLPVVRPALIVTAVITFIMAWGDLVYSLTFLQAVELQPATVGLYGYVGSDYADWNRIMAFATMMTLPVIVMFLILQQRIVQGLTAGAVK